MPREGKLREKIDEIPYRRAAKKEWVSKREKKLRNVRRTAKESAEAAKAYGTGAALRKKKRELPLWVRSAGSREKGPPEGGVKGKS